MAFDHEWTEKDYFPDIDPGVKPVGNRILVQIRQTPKKVTSSGILLVEETRETEKTQTTIAKIVAVGPLAFKKRDSGEPWPEGVWAHIGDVVRVPKWNADRWYVVDPKDPENPVMFGVMNDHEIIGVVTGDHTKLRAYL